MACMWLPEYLVELLTVVIDLHVGVVDVGNGEGALFRLLRSAHQVAAVRRGEWLVFVGGGREGKGSEPARKKAREGKKASSRSRRSWRNKRTTNS